MVLITVVSVLILIFTVIVSLKCIRKWCSCSLVTCVTISGILIGIGIEYRFGTITIVREVTHLFSPAKCTVEDQGNANNTSKVSYNKTSWRVSSILSFIKNRF